MKALLDTNIIIGREASKIINQDIGILFKWLDKAKYEKYIHQITIEEINKNPNKSTVDTFNIKLDSYELLPTSAPISNEVKLVSRRLDVNPNDQNDTILLNEVYNERVDILITEDKKIHKKAFELKLSDKVFTINSFLEKIYAENPDLVDYNVLSVQQKYFANIDLIDPFFDTLREDYDGFDKWFRKKANEKAYITLNKDNGRILSFLYIKKENITELYNEMYPAFTPKKRLKVGTFKVVSNGVRLGERFLKIIFDNALAQKVDEIYVTIFYKRPEQERLIGLLEEWGFVKFGTKGSLDELVYVRNFKPYVNIHDPKKTYPYVGLDKNIFIVPIYPEYHTELMPDSILHNESKSDFVDDEPHRNAIAKVYISRSLERNVNSGDVLIFYRTGGFYKSVVTTIAVVDKVFHSFQSENDFISKCKKRSVFTDLKLKEHWNYNTNNRPFLVNFLYIYSFPKRINLKRLIELEVIENIDSAPRGFQKISREQFNSIIKDTESDESFIVN